MNSVAQKDMGWNKIKKELQRAAYTVAVGIQGKDATADHDGITNAMLGAVHEFGSSDGSIPQRSFLRFTVNKHSKKYQQEFIRIVKQVTEGGKLKGEMLLLAEQVRGDVLKTIKESIPPPLDPATIKKKKGETTPLIETGQLWNSISGVVLNE